MRKQDFQSHDCMTILLQTLAENETKLQNLENKYRGMSGKDPYDDKKYFLQCYQKHPVQKFKAGEIIKRHSKATGLITTDTFRECAVCRKTWDAKDKDYIACSHKCDFDLCLECGSCPNGHIYDVITGKNWEFEDIKCCKCMKS